MIIFDSISRDRARGLFEIALFAAWLCVGFAVYWILSSRIKREKGESIKDILARDTFD